MTIEPILIQVRRIVPWVKAMNRNHQKLLTLLLYKQLIQKMMPTKSKKSLKMLMKRIQMMRKMQMKVKTNKLPHKKKRRMMKMKQMTLMTMMKTVIYKLKYLRHRVNSNLMRLRKRVILTPSLHQMHQNEIIL